MPQSDVKNKGRVYTPRYLVAETLDFAGYVAGEISRKHVMENSCGDGAFLCEIVRIYCEDFLQRQQDTAALAQELEEFIHGIEIEPAEAQKCRENLDAVAAKFGLKNLHWDILTADALSVGKFDGQMDFVVGNPPYVRIHNLENLYDTAKKFSFAQRGMTDLFIVFFELGFRMMKRNGGKMALITPSSWFASKAGIVLRRYISAHENLAGIIDLEHFQAFNAMTYSTISLFTSGEPSRYVKYFTFDGAARCRKFCETLDYADFRVGNEFYFADHATLDFLREVRARDDESLVRVKNGFATLADKIFVGEFAFSAGTIDVVKSSTGQWRKCIFPYDNAGNAVPLEEIKKKNPQLFAYFLANEERLKNGRDNEDKTNWHLFGRTQAIADVGRKKIAINSLIRDVADIKLVPVPAGCGVYGGLYIVSDLDFENIKKALCSEVFLRYVKSLKNYRSGGYYTFGSRDIELFLNYRLEEMSTTAA
ncbi:MAG: N-6 DNA methylase [Opitutae bacterium]|nr:N-6 DNA methylase [Opitutae bacterium]